MPEFGNNMSLIFSFADMLDMLKFCNTLVFLTKTT